MGFRGRPKKGWFWPVKGQKFRVDRYCGEIKGLRPLIPPEGMRPLDSAIRRTLRKTEDPAAEAVGMCSVWAGNGGKKKEKTAGHGKMSID